MADILEQELLNYFTYLNDEEKKSFVQLLKSFLDNRKGNTAIPSIEEYTRELEKANAEIETGDFLLHEDVVKYFAKNK